MIVVYLIAFSSATLYLLFQRLPKPSTTPDGVRASGLASTMRKTLAMMRKRLNDVVVKSVRLPDMAVLRIKPAGFYTQKLTRAGVTGVLTYISITLLGQVYPQLQPFALAAVIPAFTILASNPLKAKAERARAEFVEALVIYMDLAAAELRRGNSELKALEAAAVQGSSWPFQMIREKLDYATLTHTNAWEALGELASEIDVADLNELVLIMQDGAKQGFAVYETLLTRNDTLRERRNQTNTKRAHVATERINNRQHLLTALVIVFVLLLLAVNIKI